VRTDDGSQSLIPDDRYGTLPEAVLKVRRWHGLLHGGAGALDLEDGITVTLSATGQFRAGQYWQYEARVRDDGTGGDWRPAPHGPERRFAPLALLQYESASEPLRLLAWLDERFSHPCELDADDVAFAGARVGSSSDTVQEAIEELFERPPEIVDASCGELVIRPENDLQTVFDTIGEGQDRRICIHPGTWTVQKTVVVDGKGDLIISGAGSATLLRGAGIDTVLRFTGCGTIRIQDLRIDGGLQGLVGDGLAGSLSVFDCAGADLEHLSVSCGAATSRRMSAVTVRSELPAAGRPVVRVHDCELRAGHAQVGLLVVNAASADIEGNLVESPQQSRSLVQALVDPVVVGRIGRLVIDDVRLGDSAEFPNDFALGDNVDQTPLGDGRSRVLAFLAEWGSTFIAFTTTHSYTTANWRQLLTKNPIVGPVGGPDSPPGQVLKGLRRLRRQLVLEMFKRPNSIVQLPAPMRAVLRAAGDALAKDNGFTAGGQGIVLGGTGTPIDPSFPQPLVLSAEPRPDARIQGNRVLGFVQGIHVGTSGRLHAQVSGVSYRVTISDNMVHLRVPSLAADPHGIFVGAVFHLRIQGNTVELRQPGPAHWKSAPDMEAIRVQGTFGPLINVVENSCIGTRRSVFAFATNATYWKTPLWKWNVSGNAHSTLGTARAEQVNWPPTVGPRTHYGYGYRYGYYGAKAIGGRLL
jgi:hypothetical protein